MMSLKKNAFKQESVAIPIKGRLPSMPYTFTLKDVYSQHQNKEYTLKEAQELLLPYSGRFPGMNTGVITKLFPPFVVKENRGFDRLPIVMGNAPPEKLEMNLDYQDTRIKLAVEDKLGPDREFKEYQQDAEDLMEVVAILLNTPAIHGRPLWFDLTDNDLDALMYMVLGSYDASRETKLLKVGCETNERALQGLAELKGMAQLSIEELIHYQVFAGTVWWLDIEPKLKSQFSQMGKLDINDIKIFERDVLNGPGKLVFFFDDNGELVWDLVLIKHLLRQNLELQVTGVISTPIIANNANKLTLGLCLEHPLLKELKREDRFTVFEEDNFRSAIDPGYCSRALLDIIQAADYAFIKGVSFFETIQNLMIKSYYGFVVYSHDSQICTGLEKGSGVFVGIPKGKVGYRYLKQTLKELYPTFG